MQKKRRSRATVLLWLAAIAWVAVLFFFYRKTVMLYNTNNQLKTVQKIFA